MSQPTISVIIPLYNKEREVESSLNSVLAQTYAPVEILVVDDGSTDRSAEVVRSLNSPLIRLITQPNAGVSAARNRAAAEAQGDYIALLDADDRWHPEFLAEIAALITEFPDCGLYCTGFEVTDGVSTHPAPSPDQRGIVADFFGQSAHQYIAIPSACSIPKAVYTAEGGFPEGMKIGEDLYLWTKIARRYKVCFSPKRLVYYSKVASNRSASSYTPEKCRYSFEDLYEALAPQAQNEFVARAALGKALILSAKGGTQDAERALRFFAYTKTYRRTWYKVRILNALPAAWRPAVSAFYNYLAWKIAKKGL